MNWQRIWNDPVWSKVIAGLILGVGALPPLTAFSLNSILAGVLVSVGFLGAFLLGWTLLRAPVAWNFVGFLGMGGGGGDLRIISFQASGKNRSGKGIRNVQGHLVSNIDNSISEPLRFVIGGNPILPSSTTGIPPGANFQVTIPVCDITKGYEAYLKEYEFMQRWSTFRFVVELDGIRFERNFSERQVVREIERFRKIANPPPEPQVHAKL